MGVGVLLIVSLVIGGVASVFALGVAKVSGIDSASSRASEKPSLFIPSESPTPRAGATHSSATASASPSPSPSPSASKTTKKPAPSGFVLRAFPAKVAAGQRIYLTGRYPGGAGSQLQVQRFEGGWADFPVTAGVAGNQFSTYVSTDRSGLNRFRVLDPATNRSSNVVKVTVG